MSTHIKKVLLIEDEEDLTQIVKDEFQLDNIEVVSVTSGKAGVATAKSQDFDLVITDIVLPEMDGLQVLKEIAQHNAKQQFIAISAHDHLLHKAKKTVKHVVCLQKPFTAEDLKQRLLRIKQII